MFNKLLKQLSIKAHAVRTMADDPLRKSKFRVTIPGYPTGMGFQKVGGLSDEVSVVEYIEGMYEHAHKLPGRRKVGEVTMEKGLFASDDLRTLYKDTLSDSGERKVIVIEMMDRLGNPKKTYKLAEAWISKWEGSDGDATSDDVAIEKVTLQFEYFLD